MYLSTSFDLLISLVDPAVRLPDDRCPLMNRNKSEKCLDSLTNKYLHRKLESLNGESPENDRLGCLRAISIVITIL
jgi:hypothetical protein